MAQITDTDSAPDQAHGRAVRPSIWAAAIATCVVGILFRPDDLTPAPKDADHYGHTPALRTGVYVPAKHSARLWADDDRATLTAVFSLGNCIHVTNGHHRNDLAAVTISRPQGRTHSGFMDRDALRPATPSECPSPRALF